MRVKRTLAWTATLTLGLAALAACGSGDGETAQTDQSDAAGAGSATSSAAETPSAQAPDAAVDVKTVTFWEFNSDDAAIESWGKAIADFEALNPGIKIDLQVVPWADQSQKMATARATNTLPDISMIGNVVAKQYLPVLQNMDAYFAQWAADGFDINAEAVDGLRDYYVVDGSWYAVPYAGSTLGTYWNKEIFEQAGLDPEKPPTTWEELKTIGQTLKDKGLPGILAPYSKGYDTIHVFMSTWHGYGAHIVNDAGTCGFEGDPNFEQALGIYTSYALEGLVPDGALGRTEEQNNQMFFEGDAAVYLGGNWLLASIDDTPIAGKYGVTKIPAGPAGQFPQLGDYAIVMFSASQVKDEAAKFLEYVSNPAQGLLPLLQARSELPVLKGLSDSGAWSEYPLSVFMESIEESVSYTNPISSPPAMGAIETETVQNAVQRVAGGQQTVAESTTQLCAEINDFLAQGQ